MTDSPVASEFIQSPNHWKGRGEPIRLIVIHDEEFPERAGGAVAVAQMFTNPALQASAHYCVNDTVVQCVAEGDTAWHAPRQNSDGIGIEHGGYASFTSQWEDSFMTAELDLSARLTADIARRHNIPARWLTDAQLADGVSRGFTTHAQGTRVLNGGFGHTDPGHNFPFAAYMARVNHHLNGGASDAPTVLTHPSSFPLPAGEWFGVDDGTSRSHSGVRAGDAEFVKAIQHVVNVTEDGVFGPQTQGAVEGFQISVHLADDGLVGPLTWKAMKL